MGRAPRLTYVLDMPEATDGTHIPLRRVIVGGQPGELERECLPPALRFKIGADGVLTWEQEEESVAVDARPEGDGKEVAKLKVAAALLGVGLDEIIHSLEKARQRRNSTSALLAGVFLAVAVAVTGGVVYAWRQLETNDALLTGALKTATQMVNTAVGLSGCDNTP
jgi:hypothetical protein